jgi:hypothetical protein
MNNATPGGYSAPMDKEGVGMPIWAIMNLFKPCHLRQYEGAPEQPRFTIRDFQYDKDLRLCYLVVGENEIVGRYVAVEDIVWPPGEPGLNPGDTGWPPGECGSYTELPPDDIAGNYGMPDGLPA